MATTQTDRVALVTGAASGIGRAAAVAFARQGARVVAADVNQKGIDETLRLLRDAGGNGIGVRCDVAQQVQVDAMVASTLKAFGRLDCAFNNAGVEGTPAATADCTTDNWNRTIGINLSGVWYCLHAEIPVMLKQGRGAIVNCASVAGLVGIKGLPAYCASKHGVVGLTRAAALEYGDKGIRVNAVCPGAIQTPMLDRFMAGDPGTRDMLLANEPIGRIGRPDEIADAVLWLCSDAASFVTGQAIAVDGGWVAQ